MTAKVLAFVAALALAWILPNYVLSPAADIRAAFWMQAAFLGLWILMAVKGLEGKRAALASWFTSRSGLLLLCLAIEIFIFATVRKDFRVLTDEARLLSVSQGFYEIMQPRVCLAGQDNLGVFQCLSWTVDKRSDFFPFLVSVVHRLAGYRVENVFVVNFLAGFSVLLCVGLIAELLIGAGARLAAPLLLAAVPVMGQTFASGGFDTMNLALLLLVSLFWLYWSRQANRYLWCLIVLTYVLLGYTRYEGFVYAAAALPLLAWRIRSPSHRADILSWPTALSPLFLLPLIWRWKSFGLEDMSKSGNQVGFSLAHFLENSRRNLDYLFWPPSDFPNSAAVAWLAVLGVVILSVRTAVRWKRMEDKPFTAAAISVIGLSSLVCWVVISAHIGGDFQYPNTFRLALPVWPALALLASLSLCAVGDVLKGRLPHGIRFEPAAAAFVVFFLAIPQIRSNPPLENLVLSRERRGILEYLRRQPGKVLAVYALAEDIIPSYPDAWSAAFTEGHPELLRGHLDSGQYSKALFFWGWDCGVGVDGVDPYIVYSSFRPLCVKTLETFPHKEVDRLFLGNGLQVPVYEIGTRK